MALGLIACSGSAGKSGPTGKQGSVGPSAPIIQSLAAEGLPAAPAGEVTVTVVAQSGAGEPLTFAWKVFGDGWKIKAGESGDAATFVAPDAYGDSATASVKVQDREGYVAVGVVSLATAGNTAPNIHAVSVSAAPARRNQTFTMLASASDANGDGLTYTWSLPAGFEIVSGQGTSEITARGLTTAEGKATVKVSDQDGEAMAQVYVAAVDGAWQSMKSLLDATAYDFNIAVTSRGDVAAVWDTSDGSNYRIQTTLVSPGDQWSSVRTLSDPGQDAWEPRFETDPNGNIMAVWYQDEITRLSLWASRYSAALGVWSAPQLIMTSGDSVYDPQTASDAAGNVVAFWREYSVSAETIWANHFTAATGWGTATKLWTGKSSGLALAANANGDVVATWVQDNPTIWAARYTPNSGWAAPVTIADVPGAVFKDTQVAIDEQGNATAVWRQTGLVWSSRYDVGSGWGTAQVISAADAYTSVPVIRAGPGNSAVAVWFDREYVYARAYSPASGWEPAVPISPQDVSLSNPGITLDAQGNAVAVWQESIKKVWYARKLRGRAWSPAEVVRDGMCTTYPGCKVVFDAEGRGVLSLKDGSVFSIIRFE